MSRLDKQMIFSDEQAITASAVSTNVIDLQSNRNLSVGEPVPILFRVTEAFATLTSLTVGVQTADNEAFDSGLATLISVTVPVASLTAGAGIPLMALPRGVKRFLRLNYTVTGDNATAGKVTAGIVATDSDWSAYPGVVGGAG